MMNTEQYREHIERTFNAFCKIVLYHAVLGIYKKIRKKQQFEVSLDYLREFDFEPVTTTDEYPQAKGCLVLTAKRNGGVRE